MLRVETNFSPAKVTEDDDQNVRQGEGDEVEVHGAVEPRALDDDQDDGDVAQQPRDEDDHVKYCHRPQKSLVRSKYDETNGTRYLSASGYLDIQLIKLQEKETFKKKIKVRKFQHLRERGKFIPFIKYE